MTRTEIKHQAQDELLHHMRSAFYAASDEGWDDELVTELKKQYQRVEKLFGYEPGSGAI